jgi:RimJ/RimL family protein N-acetyltransferase
MVQLDGSRLTRRLTLRRFELGDLDDLALIHSSVGVNRYLYTEPRERTASLESLERRLAEPEETSDDNVIHVAVELQETGRVIGEFILRWLENDHQQGEIGGSLNPEYHQQGFASEVYEELLVLGFMTYGLHRVVGRCDARNAASVRSLEKAGLHSEAHFVENEFIKGEWTDEIVMAVRRDEWNLRRETRGV